MPKAISSGNGSLSPELLLSWINGAYKPWSSWLSKAKTDRQYYEGRQWTPAEVEELERRAQPVLTFNHLWSKVNSLVGMLISQKPTIKCLPRGKHDAQVASMATSVIRYVFDINQLHGKLGESFRDMITTGIGWIDVRITGELTRDPILIEYVPYDEVIFDHLSKQPDLSDARFVARGRWVEKDLLKMHFPEAEVQIDKILESGALQEAPPFMELGDRALRWIDLDRDLIFVLEVQYKVDAERDCIWDGVQAEPYDPELHDELIRAGVFSVKKLRIPVVRKAVFIGGELASDEELPYNFGTFSLTPFVAHRDIEGAPLSLVSVVRDIQDEINKRRSKALSYMLSKKVIAPEGAIPDPDEFLEQLAKPHGLLFHRPNAQIQIVDELNLGQMHYQLLQEAINELSIITGIYPDFLGQPTNARTGAALRTRILQSQNAVQIYFSAVERGLKSLAEKVLVLAKQYYTAERISLLIDEEAELKKGLEVVPERNQQGAVEPLVQVRNTLAGLRADIVVKVGAGDLTERQEQLTQLVELLKAMPPDLVSYSLDLLIEAFDIPQKDDLRKRYLMLLQRRIMMEQLALQAQMQQASGQEGSPQESPEA